MQYPPENYVKPRAQSTEPYDANPFSSEGRQWANDKRDDEHRDAVNQYDARRLLGSSVEYDQHHVAIPRAAFELIFHKGDDPDYQRGYRFQAENGDLVFDKHKLQVQASMSVEEARVSYPKPYIDATTTKRENVVETAQKERA